MALTRAPLRVGEDLFTVVTRDRGVGMEEGGTSTLTTGITQLVVTQVIVPTAARTQAKRLSFFFAQHETRTKPAETIYFSGSRDSPGTSSNLLLAFF